MEDGLDEAAQTAAEHAAASAAEPDRRARARPSRPAELEPDTPQSECANCASDLQGPVCHICGQVADEYHRPVRSLVGELAEALFALDGKVARTLPNLLGRPGRITRDYLKGKRARYMPPFRLYIIASLIFFLLTPSIGDFTGGFTPGDGDRAASIERARAQIEAELAASREAGDLTDEELEQASAVLGAVDLSPAAGEPAAAIASSAESEPGGADGTDELSPDDGGTGRLNGVSFGIGENSDPDEVRRVFAPEDFGEAAPQSVLPLSMRRFLGERFAQVAADPGGWIDAATDWAPRIMFVMVPVYALLLSLVYAWRRRFFFYDHLIVSLHFHSALFLAMAAGLIISGGGWAFAALLVYSNIYLYRLNRVVYARGRVSSVLRTLTLDVMYFFVLLLGFIAVLLLGALAG